MSGISDEMLMAYADGELDETARATVENYVSASPEAVERLRMFQATGRRLSDLFDQPMREPIPQRLIDAITAPQKVVAFGHAKSRVPGHLPSGWTMALAASLTFLAIGGSAYWFADRNDLPGSGLIGVEVANSGDRKATRELAVVLETAVSRTTAEKAINGQNLSITPMYTFATANHEFCRQYQITSRDTGAYGGVACRLPTGDWRIEAHDAYNAPKPANGGWAPAATNAGPPSVVAAVDRLMEGDALGIEAERAIMTSGWKGVNSPPTE